MYAVTLSSGLREINYDLDGIVNEKTDFAILSLFRLDNQPLANDTYTYTVNIDEETITGELEKSSTDNSFVTDLERPIPDSASISITIQFSGYTFSENLANISNDFEISKSSILEIANKELEPKLTEIMKKKETNIEVVMKLIRDFSSSEQTYYWYIGVISNNGEVIGVLLDTNTGELIAKKI